MPVFAYTSAISRILKSGTISKEDVEELLTSKNFQELLAVLYEKKLVTKEGLNAPGPVLTNLKETALLKLKGLSSMSKNSKFVADVVDAYVGLLAMDELESAISYAFSLERGNPARAFARQNLTLIRGVESISTVQSLINLVSNSSKALASALNEALNKAGKESSPSAISNLVEALILRRLYASTVSLRGDWQGPIKKILCGYADYFALSTAFALRNAVMEGCTVGEEVKDAATGNPSLLYEAIRKTELGKHVKSEKPLEALNELRVLARRNARRAAYLAFQGSPFTPAIAVAVAELIRLDYQDLVTIVTGIDARLPRDKIASLLSFELL
jgi:hypothetical protein